MRKWRKVLYQHQDVPDNYVDESFLDELKRNINVREYDYLHVVFQTESIAQAISRVVWMVTVFVELLDGRLSPGSLITFCLGVLFSFYLCYVIFRALSVLEIMNSARSLLLVLAFSYIFSPVIQTLSSTISSDTIYCMTFLAMVLHLIVHNYGVEDAPIVSDVFSFNVAMFGASCLSSRLASPLHCFGFIIFAVGLFALAPEFGSTLNHSSKSAAIIYASISFSLSVYLSWKISQIMSLLYVFTIVFVMFICPAVLVSMQPLKSTISGPWDEAIIEEKDL